MPDTLGLDKLAFLLSVKNVKIAPDFPGEVTRKFDSASDEPLDNGILYYAGGRAVRGRKAYFNTKNYHFDIGHDLYQEEPICRLHFSGNAFAESNLEPLGRDRMMDVAQMVERDLAENGVELSLSSARVTRVDIAQNVPLENPVACYDPVFSALEMRKSVNKRDFGGTGFLAGNTRFQANFYDKGAQMAKNKIPPAACPVNTLRPELRFLSGQMVNDALGTSTLKGIHAAWSDIRPVYDGIMRRDIFRAKLEQQQGVSVDPVKIARYVLGKGYRRLWNDFAATYGQVTLIQQQGEAVALEIAQAELGYDPSTEKGRRQLNRIRDGLNTLAFALKVDGTTEEGHKVVALYEELKSSILQSA